MYLWRYKAFITSINIYTHAHKPSLPDRSCLLLCIDCKKMGRADSTLVHTHSSTSSSASIDSSNHPPSLAAVPPASSSSSSSSSRHVISNCRKTCNKPDLSTNLSLGLSISSPRQHHLPSPAKIRGHPCLDWPPIKSILRNSLEERVNHRLRRPSLFVKVYMEGIPIGRKLNLLAHDSYDGLIKALSQMFRIVIQCPINKQELKSGTQNYILTYQDEEGDWMMVGDVPWEMFIGSVKRLKITRAERC